MLKNLFIISGAVSLTVILLRAASPVTDKKYRVLWRYRLLLLLALRLLIPFRAEFIHIPVRIAPAVIRTPAPDVQALPAASAMPSAQPAENIPEPTAQPVQAAEKPNSINRHTVIVICWALGCAASLGIHLFAYLSFSHAVSKSSVFAGQSAKLPVYVSPQVGTPLLIGYIKPRIILPPDCLKNPGLEQIIAHETEHFRRKDLWAKLLLCCAVSVHWFNPIIHYMVRFAARDMEYSCDDAVLAGRDDDYRKSYAKTILENINSERK